MDGLDHILVLEVLEKVGREIVARQVDWVSPDNLHRFIGLHPGIVAALLSPEVVVGVDDFHKKDAEYRMRDSGFRFQDSIKN